MATSKNDLQILRLKIQIDILQQIVFQLVIASPAALISPAQKRREELLERLEEVAQKGEQFFLQQERRTEEERVLYADETREIVEKMMTTLKSYKLV
jgi:hypothetical protein